jgi:FkbM family methyltransferase
VGLLDQFWGNKNFQFLFEQMQKLALKGLNYGRASDYVNNGESQVIQKVAAIASTASTVLFDVGANQGEFTRQIMEEWQGMAYKLYAFEPSKKTFQLLKGNIPITPFVNVFNIGFSDRPGLTELYFDKAGSGLASVYPRNLDHTAIKFTEQETIELTTLDLFCKEWHIESIDFLKMDVEGHELAVLHGAKKLLEKKCIKIIQFEFGGCNIDSRTFFKDYYNFFKEDFKLYRILGNGLRPIESYSEKLEVFLAANYLAIRKDLV